MKFTAILLFVVCMQASGKGFSQNVTLSKKDAPLENVIETIKKQTGFQFFYNFKWFQKAKKVTIHVVDVPLAQALDVVFQNQPFSYSIVGTTIVLKLNEEAIVAPELKVEADLPPFEVKGFVASENGPVAGANVVIKRTGKGTVTNGKGEFKITEAQEDDVLVITSIGYEGQEVSLKDKKGFAYVQLKVAVDRLDEVQVLAYGGTTTRRLNTGSVSRVTAEDIAKQPVTNVLQALAGRVTGMTINQNNGFAGGDIRFEVRGRNAINSDAFTSAPLVIVDGVPYPNVPINWYSQTGGLGAGITGPLGGGNGNPLFFINPNDVESIEILKDADATAIYGSRAANGVMLITTKKGKAGKTSVAINVNTGVAMNVRKVDMLTTPEYRALRREAFANNNITPTPVNAPDLFTWDSTKTTDWQKELLGHTAQTTDASVSMSGGSAGTTFLVSGNFHHENSIFPDRRGTQRSGIHYSLNHAGSSGRFNMGLSGMASFVSIKLPGGASYGQTAYTLPPNFNPFDSAGNLKWDYNNTNPYGDLRSSYFNKGFTLTSDLTLRYNILRGLDAKANFGYTRMETDLQDIRPRAAVPPAFQSFQVYNRMSQGRNQTINFEPQLQYQGNISKGRLEVMAAATIMKNIGEMPYSIQGTGFSSDAYINIVPLASSISVATSYNASQYVSFFGRANYNWQNRYIVNATFRRDGSSRFGENNRFGNFGSIGGAWLFSNEQFMKKAGFLSYGKLRGSIGWTGLDNAGNYTFLSTYTSNTPYASNPAVTPTRLHNADFSWQSTKKTEAAVELGFYKNRVLLTAAWYRNITGNQLVNYPISTQTGFSSYTANLTAAKVQNQGWEFELNTTNVNGKNFRWKTSFNFSFAGNKLLKYDGIEKTSYSSLYVVGRSLSSMYYVHYNGLDSAGKPSYVDVDKNGQINFGGLSDYQKGDRTYIGTTNPDWYGGLSNSLSYKGFQLDFTFQYTFGQKQPGYLSGLGQPGSFNNVPRKAVEDIRKLGLDKIFIRSSFSPDWANYTQSDAVINNTSFVRLTNASLSYTFSEKMVKPLHVSSLRAYLQAQNLFVISKYNGFDPESGATSVPPLLRITGGVQFSF